MKFMSSLQSCCNDDVSLELEKKSINPFCAILLRPFDTFPIVHSFQMETKGKDNKNQALDNVSQDEEIDPVLFKLSLRDLSNVTLILPLSGLFICFVSG
jgi:hypothetical protein